MATASGDQLPRVEGTPESTVAGSMASALASRVLGDPYLGHKIRMMAVHAELQEAVALAAFVEYDPFGPDEEYFGIYEYGFYGGDYSPLNLSAYVLYRLAQKGCSDWREALLPRPPPGVYGTPEEIEARHAFAREIARDRDREWREMGAW